MPRDARLQSAFFDALELPPEQLQRFALRVSGDDVAFRQELIDLLEAATEDTGDWGLCAEQCAVGAQTPEPQSGSRLGQYELLRELGRGGMGVVYLAREHHPRRRVALKLLPPGSSETRQLRFAREADWMARLDHPAIARLYAAGSLSDGSCEHTYFAMEYIDGQPITTAADHLELNRTDRLKLLLAVARGLEHAHQRGVLHRDLKPANVLVDSNGLPHIIDFGIACALEEELDYPKLTADTTAYLGTVPYMSPEQCRGTHNDIDARSDVHALGVIGFELLTERLPHPMRGTALPELMQRIALQPAPRLSLVIPDIHADLDCVFNRALALESDDRYPSVSAFAEDLERLIDGRPTLARPIGFIETTRRLIRRNRWRCAGAAALFFLTLTALVVIGMEHGRRIASERGLELTMQVARLAAEDPDRRIASANMIALQLDQSSVPVEVEIELRNLAGMVFLNADQTEAALAQHTRGLELSLEAAGPGANETLRLVDVVCSELMLLDRPEETEALLHRWLAFVPSNQTRTLTAADDCRLELRYLNLQFQHARLLQQRGALDLAISSLQSLCARRLAVLEQLAQFQDLGVPPESNPDLLIAERMLALLLAERGDQAAAVAQITATCTRVRKLPPDVMDAETAAHFERARNQILSL